MLCVVVGISVNSNFIYNFFMLFVVFSDGLIMISLFFVWVGGGGLLIGDFFFDKLVLIVVVECNMFEILFVVFVFNINDVFEFGFFVLLGLVLVGLVVVWCKIW